MSFTPNMTPEIENLVANMLPFQKKYCEHRAAGHTQGESAIRAGSISEGAAANRVGYQTENMAGSKDYILWLEQERLKASTVDVPEIISMLRDVFRESMVCGAFKDSNRAAELMAQIAGLLGKNPIAISKKEAIVAERESTNAFKDDNSEGETKTQDRIDALQRMMKDLNKSG